MVKVFCRYSHDGYTCSFYLNEKHQTASIAEHLTCTGEYVKTACWSDSFYRLEEETVEDRHGRGDGKVRVSLMHWKTRYVLVGTIPQARHSPLCAETVQSLGGAHASYATPSPPLANDISYRTDPWIFRSERSGRKGSLFTSEVEIESLVNGTGIQLLLNDRFVVVVALGRIYVGSFAAKAKTADSIERGLCDEQLGKLVLWKVDEHGQVLNG